jgi:steroid 5-alpha reductase family enzyme
MRWIVSLLSVVSISLLSSSEVFAQGSEATESGWTGIVGYIVFLVIFALFFKLISRKQQNAAAEYMKRGYKHMDRMEELTAELVTLLKRDREGAEK